MKVAVMGYGTVGSGVCEVIETHQDTLAKRTGGKALELARILDLREFPGDKHEALFTKDFNDILNDPEIQIVAETMVNKLVKEDAWSIDLKSPDKTLTITTDLPAETILSAVSEAGFKASAL